MTFAQELRDGAEDLRSHVPGGIGHLSDLMEEAADRIQGLLDWADELDKVDSPFGKFLAMDIRNRVEGVKGE